MHLKFRHLLLRALLRAETYVKTDLAYVITQSTWLSVGQVIIFASSFGLVWIFANWLDPAEYGLYKYVISVAAIASLTSITGLGIATARAIARGEHINLWQLAKLRILFGTIGAAGLLLVSLYYLYKDNPHLATLFIIATIWLPFYETLYDYQFYLQGKKQFRQQTHARIAQRFILTIIVGTTIILAPHIAIVTFAFFAATALSHATMFWYTMRHNRATITAPSVYREVVAYGKQLSLQNVFLMGVNQIDKILLFKFLGPTQLAYYFFAIAIPQELSGFLGNVNTVAFPKLVDKHSREFKLALLRKIGIFTSLLVMPVILYVAMAPYLFTWFFPQYTNAILASQIYVGTILFIPASLIWHHFYATNHSRALWFGTFVGPTVLISSILLLVPSYGLIGAVLATYVRGVIDLGAGVYFFVSHKQETLHTQT